jgi:arabinofuranosyltransferase
VSRRAAIWISALLAGPVLAFAASRAVRLAWLADDSFISFRYAWHLAHGHGLVYNAGEYVEGYTNLLWTLLMAAAMAVGVAPEVSSKALGIICWLLLAAVLAVWTWRHRERAFLPLAAALVLLMDDYQTWATGGLETSMFTLFSVAGVLLTSEPRAGARRLVLAGSLLAAAVATRPDGVVFVAVGVAGTWFVNHDAPSRRRLALVAAVTLPLIVVGTALASFSLLYYGDLFPTAFYSKSALDPYYGQGFAYLYLFLKKNWFIVPLMGILLIGGAGRLSAGLTRTHLVLLAACGAFVLYVAHSGGDFMFARRLVPAMPFLFVVLEDALASAHGVVIKIASERIAAIGLIFIVLLFIYHCIDFFCQKNFK